MAATSAKLSKIVPFAHVLRKRPDVFLAYHHKGRARIARVGIVTLGITIQPRRGYFGLAAKSARLPAPMRHCGLILKGQALESGSEAAYKRAKDRWTALIYWLTDHGYFSRPFRQRPTLLRRAKTIFPEFFTEPPHRFEPTAGRKKPNTSPT